MRFLTDCRSCGRVVVAADAVMVSRGQPGEADQGVFDCPVCDRLCAVRVSPGAVSALVARGAVVIERRRTREDGPLALSDFLELQRLLADEDSCRQLLDETH